MISTYEFDKEKLMNTPPEKLHELYDDYFHTVSEKSEYPESTSLIARDWVIGHLHILYQSRGYRVLEIGCGVSNLGHHITSCLLHQVDESIKLVSSDFSFEACKFAGTDYIFCVTCCDGHYLPFRDNSFDVVVCSHTLEHVVNPVDVLREMIRVSNRRVIIVVPDYISSDKSADYHFHNFHHIRALDKIVDEVCPFYSVEYEHITETGEICCCIEVGVSREQRINIR